MWVEIFKTGKHTSSDGSQMEFSKRDLDSIAAKYNSRYHEAPVVIGHPQTDAPAYGWVETLKTEGQVLMAKLKDLSADFLDMLRQGLFKKRSASFYKDLDGRGFYLRHVGFLGATPPAVKGLADARFSDRISFSTFDFAEASRRSAGDRLEAEIEFLMTNPDHVDRSGRRTGHLSYSEAMRAALIEFPDLAEEYRQELQGTFDFAEASRRSAGDRLGAEIEFLMTNPDHVDRYGQRTGRLSYSEAFSAAQIEFPGLVEEYRQELQGRR